MEQSKIILEDESIGATPSQFLIQEKKIMNLIKLSHYLPI
jgi:hypothetical protein